MRTIALAIARVRGDSLDRDYHARQALALGVTDLLARVRAASCLT